MIEVDEDRETGYTRDTVKLVVEEDQESLVITYADLGPQDVAYLVMLLVDRLSVMVGQSYNETLDDFKEVDDEE